MKKDTKSLRLPSTIHQQYKILAAKKGINLEVLIASVLANALGGSK